MILFVGFALWCMTHTSAQLVVGYWCTQCTVHTWPPSSVHHASFQVCVPPVFALCALSSFDSCSPRHWERSLSCDVLMYVTWTPFVPCTLVLFSWPSHCLSFTHFIVCVRMKIDSTRALQLSHASFRWTNLLLVGFKLGSVASMTDTKVLAFTTMDWVTEREGRVMVLSTSHGVSLKSWLWTIFLNSSRAPGADVCALFIHLLICILMFQLWILCLSCDMLTYYHMNFLVSVPPMRVVFLSSNIVGCAVTLCVLLTHLTQDISAHCPSFCYNESV